MKHLAALKLQNYIICEGIPTKWKHDFEVNFTRKSTSASSLIFFEKAWKKNQA